MRKRKGRPEIMKMPGQADEDGVEGEVWVGCGAEGKCLVGELE